MSWLKRTYSSESFWLKLLKESSKIKTPPFFWEAERIKVAFKGEQNLFWQQVLEAWQKMLKTLENGIQDRTSSTEIREY